MIVIKKDKDNVTASAHSVTKVPQHPSRRVQNPLKQNSSVGKKRSTDELQRQW